MWLSGKIKSSIAAAFGQSKIFAVGVGLWYQVSEQDVKVEATLEFQKIIVIEIPLTANGVFDQFGAMEYWVLKAESFWLYAHRQTDIVI